jgi:membrane protease YdiL (CAAX protease family)
VNATNELHETSPRETKDSRTLAMWEIISITASALIAEWAVAALIGSGFLMLASILPAFAFMILSHRARGESLRVIGWRIDNFFKAIKELALPILIAVAAFLLIGQILHRLDANYAVSEKWWRNGAQATAFLFARVTAWALFQEYALQGFINRRAQIIYGKNWRSLLIVGTAFAILHLPNVPLTAATFCAGIIFGYVYQRTPNIFALGLAHALLTIALVSTIPINALHDLRVGYKFFG